MWGSEIGHLRVSKRTSYTDAHGLTVLSDIQGDHGNGWLKLMYVLDSPDNHNDYQVQVCLVLLWFENIPSRKTVEDK